MEKFVQKDGDVFGVEGAEVEDEFVYAGLVKLFHAVKLFKDTVFKHVHSAEAITGEGENFFQ